MLLLFLPMLPPLLLPLLLLPAALGVITALASAAPALLSGKQAAASKQRQASSGKQASKQAGRLAGAPPAWLLEQRAARATVLDWLGARARDVSVTQQTPLLRLRWLL